MDFTRAYKLLLEIHHMSLSDPSQIRSPVLKSHTRFSTKKLTWNTSKSWESISIDPVSIFKFQISYRLVSDEQQFAQKYLAGKKLSNKQTIRQPYTIIDNIAHKLCSIKFHKQLECFDLYINVNMQRIC